MRDELMALLSPRRGHFRMESGYHSELWFELDRLFAEPATIRPFAHTLARRLGDHRLEVIGGPQSGGATLAAVIADELGLPSFAAQRIAPAADSDRLFPVNYLLAAPDRERVRGRRVAIVDDAISAGSAVRATHRDLVTCGAIPVALGAFIVFGEKAARFAAENALALESLTFTEFNMWPPDECPLCRKRLPLDHVSDAV